MAEHGRARIDDEANLPGANRREDLKKIVDAGLIDEEFQTTNEMTAKSAVVSSTLKTGCQNDVHRLTEQRLLFRERKHLPADLIHIIYHFIIAWHDFVLGCLEVKIIFESSYRTELYKSTAHMSPCDFFSD